MNKIEKIISWNIDQNATDDNFWILLDKLNELIEAVNILIEKNNL